MVSECRAKSDDDVLSVGPMQPLVTATPLGGARRHDDGMIQVNSLSEVSGFVDCGERVGTCCGQLDDFDWVIPGGDLVGRLPRPVEDEELSDIEPDVCDARDEFPVSMKTAAVESFSCGRSGETAGGLAPARVQGAGFPGRGRSGCYSFQIGAHHYGIRCQL